MPYWWPGNSLLSRVFKPSCLVLKEHMVRLCLCRNYSSLCWTSKKAFWGKKHYIYKEVRKLKKKLLVNVKLLKIKQNLEVENCLDHFCWGVRCQNGDGKAGVMNLEEAKQLNVAYAKQFCNVLHTYMLIFHVYLDLHTQSPLSEICKTTGWTNTSSQNRILETWDGLGWKGP